MSGTGVQEGSCKSTPSFELTSDVQFFAFDPTTVPNDGFNLIQIGICNAAFDYVHEAAGADLAGNSIGITVPGSLDEGIVFLRDAFLGMAGLSMQGGICVLAMTSSKIWVSVDAGHTWNVGGDGGNPYSLTGGYSTAGLQPGPYTMVVIMKSNNGNPLVTTWTPFPFALNPYNVETNQETFDYTNNILYRAVSAPSTTDGLGGIEVSDLVAMQVTQVVLLTAMYAGTGFGKPAGTPSGPIRAIVSGNGTSLYLAVADNLIVDDEFLYSSYESRLVKVDPTTMKVIAEYGDGTGGPSPTPSATVSTNVAVLIGGASQQSVLKTASGRELVAFNTFNEGTTFGPGQIFDGTAMTYLWGSTVVDYVGAEITDFITGIENGLNFNAMIAGQVRLDGSCDFWFVASNYNTAFLTLYKVVVAAGAMFETTSTPGVSWSLITTLIIPEVYPDVEITNMLASSIMYDSANNNVLIFVTDILNETQRLISVSPTGSINWTIPVNHAADFIQMSGNVLLDGDSLGIIDFPNAELISTTTGGIQALSVPEFIGIPEFIYGYNSGLFTIYAQIGGPFIRIQAVPPPIISVFQLSDLQVLENILIPQDRRVSLTWSDDAGANWAIPLTQTMGNLGEFETSIQWRRLGYARNRLIRLFWSGSAPSALVGVFVEAGIGET